ncbi:MAG TPA: hypothetical protein VED18_18110 [Candidatus Sulfotelmatobacter sp.]|nr:hypothetical protein [Candidatus Sulfotelmatobacter sp.]
MARSEPMDVLVTSGQSYTGLNVARSLGRAGLRVLLGGSTPASPGFASRYVCGHFVYPSAARSPRAFVEAVAQQVERWRPRLVIPGDDSTLAALSQAAHRFAGRTRLACPPFEVVRQLLDKEAMLALAARLGIPMPRTVRLDRGRPVGPQLDGFRFPVVLKPTAKYLDGRGDRFKVLYCRDTGEVARCLAELPPGEPGPLAQEYIAGNWVCVAVLLGGGRPLAFIQYRAPRALPPGGVGVRWMAEPAHPDLVGHLVRLLRTIGWDGVAQGEFWVEDGVRPYLLDVNGRFWGSIGFTLAAGMDFPVWLYRYLVAGEIPQPAAYRAGVGCRRLVGELQRLEHFLRGWKGNDPRDCPSKVRALGDFLAGCFNTGNYDEFLWGDLRPGLRALWQWGVGRWWWRLATPSGREVPEALPGLPAEAGQKAWPAR